MVMMANKLSQFLYRQFITNSYFSRGKLFHAGKKLYKHEAGNAKGVPPTHTTTLEIVQGEGGWGRKGRHFAATTK